MVQPWYDQEEKNAQHMAFVWLQLCVWVCVSALISRAQWDVFNESLSTSIYFL